MARKDETQIQIKLAEYIAENYPNVEFHSDYGSGARLRPYQAKEQSEMNAGRRAWPDVMVAETVLKHQEDGTCTAYSGLFIELKREGTKISTKKGTLVADKHIREQYDKLVSLRQRGYVAEFACGLEEAKLLVDEYLA